jgi:tetratricopeptide (TPR) repeat protein
MTNRLAFQNAENYALQNILMKRPLQPPDSHHLSATIGWLGLGNHLEAIEELEKIEPALRAHPDVLLVRFEIYSKAGEWDVAAEAAAALVKLQSNAPGAWIALAYATRRKPGAGGGVLQAKEILLPAQTRFPKVWLIPYNLACYECQLGNQKAAWAWLEMAFELGEPRQLKLMALIDPDLEVLWAKIAEI